MTLLFSHIRRGFEKQYHTGVRTWFVMTREKTETFFRTDTEGAGGFQRGSEGSAAGGG